MQWFIKDVCLSEGQSFGELALIHDKPRAATVVCEEDVVCGVINKQTYQRVIEKIEKQRLELRMEILRGMDFLKHWSYMKLKKLTYSFDKKDYIRGQMVYT